MSQENVEIVRRVYEAIDRGDTATVLTLYDPEIEWHFARSPFRTLVRNDVYRGRDGLRDFIRERYEDAWESISDQLLELVDAGDHVVTVVQTGGRGRASGVQTKKTHAGIWTVRTGRVVRVEWMSLDDALEAAGLEAMSEENVEIYREVLAAWNDGDVDRMLTFMAGDVEIHSFLAAVEGGYHGHDGVRRWWQNFHETFPDWHADALEIRSVNDATIARLRLRGHGGESGVPVDRVMWHVAHLRDGRAIRLSAHETEADALEAAGQSE